MAIEEKQEKQTLDSILCEVRSTIQSLEYENNRLRTLTQDDLHQQNEDYTPGSIVSLQKNRLEKLVKAHWSYMEKTLEIGQDMSQTFTWGQVMEMRKWDYTSAATHFYGHGYEDAKNEQGDFE